MREINDWIIVEYLIWMKKDSHGNIVEMQKH